jgi:hypothetical protein
MKKIILASLAIILNINLFSQIAPNTYVVKFTDKTANGFSISEPSKFLSPRSIQRRTKFNIPITEQDLPVTQSYIDSLKKMGFQIYAVSKWLNLAVVYSENSLLIDQTKKLSFVSQRSINQPFKENQNLKNKPDKIKLPIIEKDTNTILSYGLSANQVKMLNTQILHNKGFMGQGIEMAILDAGFYHADKLPAFDSIFTNHQIIGIRDFVERDNEVYADDTHGMMVLSTIAGNIPGKLIGTSPKAKFWLIRTEQEKSEYIVEEYYWLAGAEFADSVGVDMIHSSLGYNDFDDKVNSHLYKDMNGHTAPASIAAMLATRKGILVVTSAGNEGNDPWKYISAPADADSILAVGAVQADSDYAYFSSRGPSADGRVKPDVVAQGMNAYVQSAWSNTVTTASGTSFSGPIMAGAVACLWQANPTFSNIEIIDAVIKSCDQYTGPNTFTGYGIPNLAVADAYLKMKKTEKTTK